MLLKFGALETLFVDSMPSYVLFDAIQHVYNLDDYVKDRLGPTYCTYSRSGNTKYVKHIDTLDGQRDDDTFQENDIINRSIRTSSGAKQIHSYLK